MLRLIYSTQRHVLRRTCLELAIRHTEQEPDSRVLLVVPEQTKMDMEQDYLTMSRAPGLMQAEVLSFRRLAWRLLGEVGRQPLFPVDPVGRAMLIHRVLHQNKDLLHSFGYLADKPGFIRQVTAVLGDLKRYRIGAKQLQAAAEKAEEKALKDKSLDLAIVLGGYDAALAEAGLTDAEDDLTRLAELLQTLSDLPGSDWPWPWSRLGWLKRTHVLVSGFGEVRDFTPQESMVLRGLADLCAHMTLTAAADAAPGDSQVLDQGLEAFMAGRRTIWHLQAVLPGLEIRRVDAETTGLQTRIARLLRHGNLDREPGTQDGCQLRLIRAASTDDELSYLAGMIRQLVQLEGYRYRDISVALCSLPSYLPRLRAIFREYGLPLFLDMERPLNGSPLMRHVLGLLDIGLTNWSRQALMGYLRAGLSGLTAADIDRLENAWLARGLFRRDRIFRDALYRLPGLATETETEAPDADPDEAGPERETPDCSLLTLRDQALLPVRDALRRLSARSDVQGKVAALRQILADSGMLERVEDLTGRWAGQQEMDAAVMLAQSWNALQRVLDQLVQLTPDLPVSLKQFRDSLSAGLDTAAAGVIPSAIDQVGIGDLQRSMLRRAKVLFVIGASAQNLPPALPPEGLLKDPDRQRITQLIGQYLPSSARDKVFADSFVIDALLTQPAERLFLSTASPPANLFNQLAAQYPGCLMQLPECCDRSDPRLNAPAPALRWLLGNPSGLAPLRSELAGLFADSGLQLPEAGERSLSVRPDLMRSLYEAPVVLSVSQLEKYASCPFSHLAERLLSLQMRPEWRPEVTETGVLLHGVLERAMQAVRQDLLALPEPERERLAQALWDRWLQADLSALIDAWMRETAEQEGLERLFDAGLNASAGRRVRRTAQSSLQVILAQYRQEKYQPARFEWVFDPQRQGQLRLPMPPGQPVWLRGKIDRIDHDGSDGETTFRVIDYKSGQRTADYLALYHGLALQLPIYLAAYAGAHPNLKPADAAWFTVNRPYYAAKTGEQITNDALAGKLVNMQKPSSLNLEPDDLVRLCRHARWQAARLAGELLSGRFPVRPCLLPGQKAPCSWCDYRAMCRFDGNPSAWYRPAKLPAQEAEGTRGGQKASFLEQLRKAFPDPYVPDAPQEEPLP